MPSQGREVWQRSHFIQAVPGRQGRGPSIPSNIGPIRPFMLIMLSLFLVAGVGAVSNSLASSGLISLAAPPTSPVNVCTAANYLNCYYGYQYNIPTGCNANIANCQLGGTGGLAGIFSQTSPFTYLFTGNIFGFWNALTSSGPVNQGTYGQGPFDAAANGPYYNMQCDTHIPNISNVASIRDWVFPYSACKQISTSGNQTLPESQTFLMTNWNTGKNQANKTVTTPFYNMQFGPNGTGYSFNCALVGGGTSLTGFGSTNQTNNQNGYTYFGCDLFKGANPNTLGDPWFSVLVSIPNIQGRGVVINSNVTFSALVQPENWETYFCGLYGQQPQLYQPYASPQCTVVWNNLNENIVSSGQAFNWGWLTPIVTFLLGLILVLIGIGGRISAGGSVVGTGTTGTVAVNSQGARLGQALGLFLLVWSPLYSEFGAWTTSGLLGSTGLELFMLFVIYGSGFFGVFWQMLSFT